MHREMAAIDNAKRQNKLEIAKSLRDGGMGVDDVAKHTGLTIDDVLRLQGC